MIRRASSSVSVLRQFSTRAVSRCSARSSRRGSSGGAAFSAPCSRSVAVSGARLTSHGPAWTSQSSTQPWPSTPASTASKCSATGCTPPPAASSARATCACSAERSPAGIDSASPCRISPCRNRSPGPASASTPAATASRKTGSSSDGARPPTVDRSGTENSAPSTAASRNTSNVGSVRNANRSEIPSASDTGPPASPASSTVPPRTRARCSRTSASTSSRTYSGFPPAAAAASRSAGPTRPPTSRPTSSATSASGSGPNPSTAPPTPPTTRPPCRPRPPASRPRPRPGSTDRPPPPGRGPPTTPRSRDPRSAPAAAAAAPTPHTSPRTPSPPHRPTQPPAPRTSRSPAHPPPTPPHPDRPPRRPPAPAAAPPRQPDPPTQPKPPRPPHRTPHRAQPPSWPTGGRVGGGDDLHPGSRAELGQDVGHVRLDRAAGEVELGGDVRVGPAGAQQFGDLELGRGQRRPSGRWALPRFPPDRADTVGAQPRRCPARVEPGAGLGVLVERGLQAGPGGGGVPGSGVGDRGVLVRPPGRPRPADRGEPLGGGSDHRPVPLQQPAAVRGDRLQARRRVAGGHGGRGSLRGHRGRGLAERQRRPHRHRQPEVVSQVLRRLTAQQRLQRGQKFPSVAGVFGCRHPGFEGRLRRPAGPRLRYLQRLQRLQRLLAGRGVAPVQGDLGPQEELHDLVPPRRSPQFVQLDQRVVPLSP